MRRILLFVVAAVSAASISGCATQRTELKSWWSSSGKANVQATAQLLAQEAAAIAEKTVYAKGLDASDVVLKNFNVQGFGDGLRTLETGLPAAAIGQIPDFVMNLRKIWLPSQQHYTDLAANLGTLMEARIAALEKQTGRKLSSDEATQIVEGVIKGLQTEPKVLVGP